MTNSKEIETRAYRLLKTLGRKEEFCRNDKPYFMLGFLSGHYKSTPDMMKAIVTRLKDNCQEVDQ